MALRFSNPNITAPTESLPWESGIPVTPFWDSLDWVCAVHFLGNFSEAERTALPIDPNSTAGAGEKTQLLLSLLEEKLARQDEVAGWAEGQPRAWRRLILAQHVLQSKLGMVAAAGQSIRMLVERFGDGDVVLQQSLADQLVAEGEYGEAERILGTVVERLDEDMGRASPQAIGGRRALLAAVWKQGVERRADAERVVEEIREAIRGMVGTEFEVYVQDEEEELEKVLAELAVEG